MCLLKPGVVNQHYAQTQTQTHIMETDNICHDNPWNIQHILAIAY